ncbi:MAG TPA: hypothetical protein DCQ37_12425 [Desulfobacteraceae bacterium]|nr:hypothetical protein [Desulfobacteraceae bacterium]
MKTDRKTDIIFIIMLMIFFAIFMPISTDAKDKKIYRIAYLEPAPYWIFSHEMEAIKKSLAEMGWKDKIEFPADAYFSPGREEDKKPLWSKRAEELMARKDIDLIITAGTDATATILKANKGQIPIVAISVSDPVKSKFVLNEKDSGVDNFTVRIVPNQFKRMFEIFHDVVGFKKLGLVYWDTENGKRYTNLDDAHLVAKERGFEVIEYKKVSESGTAADCLKGLQELASQKIDAFFIPSLNCFDWKNSDVKMILDYLAEKKIPTFARNGTRDVKAGGLMGFSSIDFSGRGKFIADKIVRIFQGEKPRSLPMIDNAIPKISINLYVAKKIGFNPPFDILAASDELFQEITLPDDRLVK